MAVTEAPVAPAAPGTDAQPRPGRLARWAARDPVRTVALVLIAASVVWRADIASRGFLALDDFILSTIATQSPLDADYLLLNHADHLFPGGTLIYWLVAHGIGLEYWPYLLLLMLGQALVGVAFFRLLRDVLRPGWGVLLPLCLFLFCPLTLDATSVFIIGVLLLPMQLALVLALGAQVKYARTRRARHLVTLGLSLLLGLVFYEKSLLIVPLVFLTTACLLVEGGMWRSLRLTVTRFWPAWLVLGVISGGYLALYFWRAPASSLRMPSSVGEVVTFVRQLVGETLVPALVGGPWRWLPTADDFPPLAAPDGTLRWLAWIVVAAVVIVTAVLRPTARRAWILLAAYLVLVCALLAATRLGSPFSGVAGLVARYIDDAVIVAALSVGVAVVGLRDGPHHAEAWRPALPAAVRRPETMAVALVLCFAAVLTAGVGTARSAAGFANAWQVKHGRDYLRTAEAELVAAPPGTVFFDQPVPEHVLSSFAWPNNLQSRFFAPARVRPVFVTEAENPSILDLAGHIHRAGVEGVKTPPGPEPGCGYKIGGGLTYRLLLDGSQFAWTWAVRVGYLASDDATATLHFGEGTRTFAVKRGLHQVVFMVEGGGTAVELILNKPGATMCIDQVVVGALVTR